MTTKKKNTLRGFIVLSVLVIGFGTFGLSNKENTKTYASATGMAPIMQGTINRQGNPNYGVVNGYVVEVSWSQLQAKSTDPINTTALDSAITYAKNHNLRLKIRLLAGDCLNMPKDLAPRDPNSPSACAPDPTTVTVNDTNGKTVKTVHVGHYWEPAMLTAYRNLMQNLAAKYDKPNSGLNEITNSLCMSVWAEPFINHMNDSQSVQDFLTAGYTDAKGRACIKNSIDAHRVWKYVRTSLSFNPWDIIDGTPAHPVTGTNEAFTESMIDYCRSALGQSCVLENNSIRASTTASAMYAKIKTLGPPITFQTAATVRICGTLNPAPSDSVCLGKTLDFAIGLGANAVELPTGYDSTSNSVYMPETTLAVYDTKLTNNPTGDPSQPDTCPTGQTGTPPNCTTPPPATCPTGQTGTPPKCLPANGSGSGSGSSSGSPSSACCAATAPITGPTTKLGLPPGTDPTKVVSVTYAIDGKVLAVETKFPFTYNFDTTKLTNGCHLLVTTIPNKDNTKTTNTKKLCINHPTKWYEHKVLNIIIGIILIAGAGTTALLIYKPAWRSKLTNYLNKIPGYKNLTIKDKSIYTKPPNIINTTSPNTEDNLIKPIDYKDN